MDKSVQEVLASARLDQSLYWHLTYNFYPAKSLAWIPVAKEAIELVNQGEPEAMVNLPAELANGQENCKMFSNSVIEYLRLEDYIESEE